ncbi:MAG: TerB family tellurite resistance protein [Gammaproteobacteria bacterium]|nr:TerB family tellurite resistance protein [Gammaproteobacteria bacterium]
MTNSKAKQLTDYSFLVVFANDGTIDAEELAMMERLALEDGIVDDDERQVLQRIFSRLDPDSIDQEVREEIERFRSRYNI